MSDPTFDPESFIGTETTETFDTTYTPIPEAEYPGVVKKVEARTTSSGRPILDVYWLIDDQSVRELMDSDEPTCRQTIWLDLKDGQLESGKNKNVQLGALREAVGQDDGKPWRPAMLEGAVGVVQVKHGDPNPTTGAVFANVVAVRRA